MRVKATTKPEAGFTLIELSIVLVIIGLIVGGILVGQDMIRAAEIRSTIKQIETYNTAANTFRDKYKFLPGDATGSTATNFGFVARNGGAGRGDGNGLLVAGALAQTTNPWNENLLFWTDLSSASMIDTSFTFSTADATVPTAIAAAAIPTVLPQAKMGRSNYITVYSVGGFNYYQLGGITAIAVTTANPSLATTLSPQEAFNIDTKMDDGVQSSGVVVARLGSGTVLNTNPAVPTTAGAGDCLNQATGNPYNTIQSDWANTPACALRIRFN